MKLDEHRMDSQLRQDKEVVQTAFYIEQFTVEERVVGYQIDL